MGKKNFDPYWPLQAAAYFHAGLNRDEIAAHFGLSRSEFDRWCRRHRELARAVDSGRLDDPVEEALLKRAIGTRQVETVREDIIDKKTGEILENCKERTVVKEIPPDIRAQLFWLKNRRPARWKDGRNEDSEDYEFTPDSVESSL